MGFRIVLCTKKGNTQQLEKSKYMYVNAKAEVCASYNAYMYMHGRLFQITVATRKILRYHYNCILNILNVQQQLFGKFDCKSKHN